MNKNKTNIEFLIVLVIALILIYLSVSFVEFSFMAGDWTVIGRVFAVLSFFSIGGFTAKNLYK